MNPLQRQNITPEQRRQLLLMHLQGLNHQPVVDNHRRQQEAAFTQRINAYVVELLKNQQEIQQLTAELLAGVEALDALPMLRERNAVLQNGNTQLKEVQKGLVERLTVVKLDLNTAHEQRATLLASINQMRDKLKSAEGKQYAAQSGIETGSMAINTLVAKVTSQSNQRR